VTTICPGAIDTDLVRWLGPHDPSRRHLLRAADVAAAIVYALSQPPQTVIDRIVLRPFNEPPHGAMIDPATMDELMEAWAGPISGG
jgi:NADP-dependent 3-hydroxy acid dehydrogenase YdfG